MAKAGNLVTALPRLTAPQVIPKPALDATLPKPTRAPSPRMALTNRQELLGKVVARERFELSTPRLRVVCSNQLSYLATGAVGS